jgi:hypothetical protein
MKRLRLVYRVDDPNAGDLVDCKDGDYVTYVVARRAINARVNGALRLLKEYGVFQNFPTLAGKLRKMLVH